MQKKEPSVYENAGRNAGNALVQKAKPLVALSKTDLTLPEFKILDAYLSRINSRDPSKRTVRFEKGVLEETLGVTKIPKGELKKRLRHLFQTVELEDESKADGFKLISLFDEADAQQDEFGLWQITLTCSASAREYIFNIETIGYLRYRLNTILSISSRYSYIMFLYLERNRFRKEWEVPLDELKKELCCTATTYNEYKRFNDLILKRCQKELSEKTGTEFSYEPKRKGRSVAGIRFTIETMPAVPQETETLDSAEQFYGIDERDPYWVYGPLPWLTDAQGEEVKLLTLQVPKSKLPDGGTDTNSYYDYLNMVKSRLNRAKEDAANRGKPIRDEYAYLLAMIKKDADLSIGLEHGTITTAPF